MATNEQREEFERRLLALVRSQMDISDRNHPEGWEISDFIVTARIHYAPEPGTPLEPWAGGPYPGWNINAWTRGSSDEYWYDAQLLQEALDYSLRMHEQWLSEVEAEDEPEDEGTN